MAKYTVQLRTILEQKWLDLNPDKTVCDLEKLSPVEVISTTWDSVVTNQFPVWEGMTQAELMESLFTYYYTREIGLETVALWRLFWNNRMKAIMPYYASIANAQLKLGNIYENINYKDSTVRKGRESNDLIRNVKGTTDNVLAGNSSNDIIGHNSENGKSLFSDTPQDGLEAVENGTYLTTATIDNSESTTGQNQTQTVHQDNLIDSEQNHTENATKGYGENVDVSHVGFNGSKVNELAKFKEVYESVVPEIINKVADLFMSIY